MVFSVTLEEDGGFVARCLQQPIFTEADTWEGLCQAVVEAVTAWHFDRHVPERVRLHLVRDEVFTLA